MGDGPSAQEKFKYARPAILREASRWYSAHEKMESIGGRVKGGELLLTAFFTLPQTIGVAALAKQSYDSMKDRMESLANQAAAEFDDINLALKRCVDAIEQVDNDATKALDLIPIYGQEEALG